VAGLPIDDSSDLFEILRINEDVVIMQVIVPEPWAGDARFWRNKRIDDLLVPCQRSDFLFRVRLVKVWAAKQGELFRKAKGMNRFCLPIPNGF
jgi:hypothetical protein